MSVIAIFEFGIRGEYLVLCVSIWLRILNDQVLVSINGLLNWELLRQSLPLAEHQHSLPIFEFQHIIESKSDIFSLVAYLYKTFIITMASLGLIFRAIRIPDSGTPELYISSHLWVFLVCEDWIFNLAVLLDPFTIASVNTYATLDEGWLLLVWGRCQYPSCHFYRSCGKRVIASWITK